jgi:hypothetical protein
MRLAVPIPLTFRSVAHFQNPQASLEYAVGKLTVANASIDFFVSLISQAFGIVVALSIPKLLVKFSEARFARYSSLPDPLLPIERLRMSKKHRPKQHRED